MKKILLLVLLIFSTLTYSQKLIPSLIGNAGEQTKAGTTIKTISWTTNSTSATYTINSLINIGSDLTWSTSGAVVNSGVSYSGNNKPTYDLSTSGGSTTTITISSSTSFNGLTTLSLASDEVASINITEATDIVALEIKDNANLSTTNISTLLNLEEAVIRTNPLQTSLNLSGNPVLWELYAYDNALTTLDLSANPLLTVVVVYGNDLPSSEIDQILIDLDNHGLSNGTLNYSGNTGSPTSASYDAYNSLISKSWTITGTVPPSPTPDPPSSSIAGLPVISNFHVKDGEPTKVYFDTNETITASNTTGFYINDQTISSITIIGATQTGHYFTISPGVTFWDNNTIRYEGGSNIQDTETNGVANFTLTHIVNNIVEPTASTIRYASSTGSGSNTGLDQSNEWTYQQAFTNATSGMTVWMKAGSSSTACTIGNSGTISSPIKFIGYKVTPGDIISNYYDYVSEVTGANDIDVSEMPSLVGASEDSGVALNFDGEDYIILKNFQTEKWYDHLKSNNTSNGSNYVVIDNYNSHLAGGAGGANDMYGIRFQAYDATVQYYQDSKFIRLTNSVFIDHKAVSVLIRGDGRSLLENVKTYNSESRFSTTAGDDLRNDYHIAIGGWHNIIKNSYSENINNTTGWNSNLSTHGIGIRGEYSWRDPVEMGSKYNLITGCNVVNIYDGIYFRNHGTDYNVAKDFTIGNGGNTLDYRTGGMMIMSGPDNNIFERGIIDGVAWGIYFTNNQEDNATDTEAGNNNIFRNLIIKNCVRAIAFHEDGSGPTTQTGNRVYNSTFYNNVLFAQYIGGTGHTITDFDLTNNIIADDGSGANAGDRIGDLTFDYTNLWNTWTTTLGTNSTNVNPSFTDLIEFSPETIMSGIPITDVEYDLNKLERDDVNPTIGAVESPTVVSIDYPVLSNFRVENATPTRVYFDSSESITGSTITGFTISGKTVTNISINGSNLTGHYFTVSSAFDFWDNNTIRYEGGSNIQDSDTNALIDFTLTHIVNNINEPVATNFTYYVASDGSSGNNGTSISTPKATLQQALTLASGQTGVTIWVKAGNYSPENITQIPSGTTTAPNKIIGYKTTPGDITSNYYSYTVDSGDGNGGTVTPLSSVEMPLFTGASREIGGGTFMDLSSDNNIIIKNIQITNYNEGFYTDSSYRNILENVNVVNIGSTTNGSYEGRGIVMYDWVLQSSNHRIKNCYVVNATSNAYLILATYSLFENSYAYCNEYDAAQDVLDTTDYYFTNQGNNNIFTGCIAWKDTPGGGGHNGHGFAMKALNGTYPGNYNLVDNCLAVNILGAFQLRHPASTNNVIKNSESHANVANRTPGSNQTSGVEFLSGNANNIIENCYFHHVDNGVNMVNNNESASTVIGEFVTFRNNIFTNVKQLFRFGAVSAAGASTVENISFFNNTIDTADQMNWGNYTSNVTTVSFNMTNNILTNITSHTLSGTLPNAGFSYNYNNFYANGSWDVSYITGTNMDINPIFTGFYVPTATMTGQVLSTVPYDYNWAYRTLNTVGAVNEQ